MRTSTTVGLVLASVLMVNVSNAQPIIAFKADLDGTQAGTTSTATGSAIIAYTPTFTELRMLINLNGLTTTQVTGFHIREAAAGVAGPIIFGLVNPNHDVNDFIDLGVGYFSRWGLADTTTGAAYDPASLQVLVSLLTEGYYFSAETAAFPTGEIRGQIVPVIFGDINLDGSKDLLDVPNFVNLLTTGAYQVEADFDLNGVVDLIDIPPFIRSIIIGC